MEEKKFMDYYTEFEIERTADCNEIRNKLGTLEADYLQQRAVCITSDQMEVLQKLLDIIGDAIYYLANENRRKKYDKKLEQMAKSGELNKQQTQANSDYEQAQLYEQRGKAKEAIIFAERAVAQNIYNQDAYALMIRCCYKIGDYSKALDVAESKAIRIYPYEVSFPQYAARIRTLQGDYDGASDHIQNLMVKHSDNSAGYIEQAVMLLYMSEDARFQINQKKQARDNAEAAINNYLSEHSNDEYYRSSIATALIGLSERHYSTYEGVTCKIIATKEDYSAILGLHEWAGKISNDSKVQSAVNDVRIQGKLKYNSDNTRSLLCLSGFGIISLVAIIQVLTDSIGHGISFGANNFISSFVMIILFVVPWLLLIKVSLRPLWMIDRIRYTGHVDLLEQIMVAYGLLVIKLAQLMWRFVMWIFKFAISLASRS